ncbi:MAG TPA: helix-turn-helix domain-containing protein [Caulobacteraceae bacterium]|nr:helix-turn-helix domain-containing protein [Caulobacteraceae bacterium]
MAAVTAGLSSFLILVLASKRPRRGADVWLAVWFAAQLVFCANLLLSLSAPPAFALPLLLLGQAALLLLAPTQYLYAASVLSVPDRRRVHFSLVGVVSAAFVIFGIVGPVRTEGGAIVVDVANRWFVFVPPLLLLGSTAYPLAILNVVARRRADLMDDRSNLEGADPGWLRAWAYACIVLLISFAALFLAGAVEGWPAELHMNLTLAFLAGHLAYVGQRGLTRPEVFYSAAAAQLPAEPEPPVDLDAARADYASVEDLLAREKPYRDPDLTAQALADRMGWGGSRLTQALKHGGGTTFFDAINAARVRELQALAAQPDNADASLLVLAYEAGFGSKSCLYEAFRRHAGATPAAWRRSMGRDSSEKAVATRRT